MKLTTAVTPEIHSTFKVFTETVLGGVRDLLVLLLLVCEEVNQSRHEHHDDLRHYDELDEEQAVEETLRSHRQRQTIDVVQSHG